MNINTFNKNDDNELPVNDNIDDIKHVEVNNSTKSISWLSSDENLVQN